VAIDLGCDHPGHHSPDFFDWTATDLDFGDKCECLHKSSDANGSILVATECLRADKTFAGRVQIALNSAFAEVENAFVHGKPNKQFQGTTQLESNLRYHIHHKVLHLFNICHKYCDGHKPKAPPEEKEILTPQADVPGEEAPSSEQENATTQVDEDADLEFLGATEYSIAWHGRKGTIVTCPHQQQQIIYYINKKVVAAIPHLIVPDYGVVNTNANEGVGGRALFSRGKNILIGPVQLATKEVRNLIGWQAIQLGRCNIDREWQHNVLSALERDFAIPAGSLSTSTAREAARSALQASIAGSLKRRGEEQQTKLARWRKRKRRTTEGRRTLGTDYDPNHDGNGWDASAKKVEESKARRAPPPPKAYKLMNCCAMWANNHTVQKCPFKPQGQIPQSQPTKRPRLQPPRPPSPVPVTIPTSLPLPPTVSTLQLFFGEDYDGIANYEVVQGYHPNLDTAAPISFGGGALFDVEMAPAVNRNSNI
jgi:hypothetical protein